MMSVSEIIKELLVQKKSDPPEELCKKVFTIPNIISMVRILLVAPSAYFIIVENYIAAAILLVVSGLSDMFDGIIARKCNQITKLGQILDPVADKLTLAAVVISFSFVFPEITPLAIILVCKELLMLIFGISLINRHITSIWARWYGKLATVLFYITVITIVGLKAFLGYSNSMLNWIMFGITAASMIFANIKYYIVYLNLIRKGK